MVPTWFLKEKTLIWSDLKLVHRIHSWVFSFTESLSETNVISQLEVKGNYFYIYTAFCAQRQRFHISTPQLHRGKDSHLV